MLPFIQKLNGWKNAQIVRVNSFSLYFSLHDDCPTCRGLIAFEVDGNPRVVCDVSGKRGGLAHTTTHRKFLQPDQSRWATPAEFAHQWLEQTSIPAKPTATCSGPTCNLPSIGFYAKSVSAKVVMLGPVNLYFSYENNGHWPDMVGFRVSGQEATVSDVTNWPSPGNTIRTTAHRASLQPDRQKWLPPLEFHQRWLEWIKTKS